MKAWDKNKNKNNKIWGCNRRDDLHKGIVEIKMRIVNFNLKFIMIVKLITDLYG